MISIFCGVVVARIDIIISFFLVNENNYTRFACTHVVPELLDLVHSDSTKLPSTAFILPALAVKK